MVGLLHGTRIQARYSSAGRPLGGHQRGHAPGEGQVPQSPLGRRRVSLVKLQANLGVIYRGVERMTSYVLHIHLTVVSKSNG